MLRVETRGAGRYAATPESFRGTTTRGRFAHAPRREIATRNGELFASAAFELSARTLRL